MITRYDLDYEDIVYQLTDEEKRAIAEAIAGGGGGGGGTATQQRRELEAYSETELRQLWRAERITEEQWKAELVARGASQQAAADSVARAKNVGVSTAVKTRGELTASEQAAVDSLRASAPPPPPQMPPFSPYSPSPQSDPQRPYDQNQILTSRYPEFGQQAAGASGTGPAGRTFDEVTGKDYLSAEERTWYLAEAKRRGGGGGGGASTGGGSTASTSRTSSGGGSGGGGGSSTGGGGSMATGTSPTDKAGSAFQVRDAEGNIDTWREFHRADGSSYYRNLNTGGTADLLPRSAQEKKKGTEGVIVRTTGGTKTPGRFGGEGTTGPATADVQYAPDRFTGLDRDVELIQGYEQPGALTFQPSSPTTNPLFKGQFDDDGDGTMDRTTGFGYGAGPSSEMGRVMKALGLPTDEHSILASMNLIDQGFSLPTRSKTKDDSVYKEELASYREKIGKPMSALDLLLLDEQLTADPYKDTVGMAEGGTVMAGMDEGDAIPSVTPQQRFTEKLRYAPNRDRLSTNPLSVLRDNPLEQHEGMGAWIERLLESGVVKDRNLLDDRQHVGSYPDGTQIWIINGQRVTIPPSAATAPVNPYSFSSQPADWWGWQHLAPASNAGAGVATGGGAPRTVGLPAMAPATGGGGGGGFTPSPAPAPARLPFDAYREQGISSVPGLAGGGSMMTQEPILGVGMQTGNPLFVAGEAGPEQIDVTPMAPPPTPFAMLMETLMGRQGKGKKAPPMQPVGAASMGGSYA